MSFNQEYIEKTRLLIEVAGQMDWESCFAIKGGTAINLFYSNLPRLSVDIDLVYGKEASRNEAFEEMITYLEIHAKKLNRLGFDSKRISTSNNNPIGKLIVSRESCSIIIEPNFIARGTVLKTQKKVLCEKAIEIFQQEIEARCLDIREIYAGKMNAFLSRQHPRDIFDMMEYLKGNSLNSIIDVIMVYILQNNRPFHELLNPNEIEIVDAYQNSFLGMTREEVKLETLLEARTRILAEFKKCISNDHIDFFISCLKEKPEWDIFKEYKIETFPGIRWRMLNIKKMSAKKKKEEIHKLLELKSIT
ncbi:MAG: hypothetical protein A2Y40_10035 [Candidatus Margulisbacteria bacterium GWF2_35_9]|nr:MAG: hypothetical protein A2Y40_10035 [Candidatus Margulisbacteria bacterium GWF2_35_9]